MSVDIQDVLKKYSKVEEINEIVGVWEIWIKECPVKLKIKVIRLAPLSSDVPYMGSANYLIQNPTQGDPYKSLHNCSTVQEALEDALRGFLTFYKSELIDRTKFVLDDDW